MTTKNYLLIINGLCMTSFGAIVFLLNPGSQTFMYILYGILSAISGWVLLQHKKANKNLPKTIGQWALLEGGISLFLGSLLILLSLFGVLTYGIFVAVFGFFLFFIGISQFIFMFQLFFSSQKPLVSVLIFRIATSILAIITGLGVIVAKDPQGFLQVLCWIPVLMGVFKIVIASKST